MLLQVDADSTLKCFIPHCIRAINMILEGNPHMFITCSCVCLLPCTQAFHPRFGLPVLEKI